jgi:hypothetical protein
MPRRHKNRHRTMKGGFLDNITSTLSGWGSSVSQGATSWWQKTKDATSNLTGTSTPTTTPTTSTPITTSTPTTPTQPMTTSTYGGRTRRHRMKGGFKDNTSTTGLAVHAAPFSGPTAQPHNWVGGKTKRRNRKHRHTKYCRHRR